MRQWRGGNCGNRVRTAVGTMKDKFLQVFNYLVPTVPTLLLPFLKKPVHVRKYPSKQTRTRAILFLAPKSVGTVGTVGTVEVSLCFY
jgi:hypothetical protein